MAAVARITGVRSPARGQGLRSGPPRLRAGNPARLRGATRRAGLHARWPAPTTRGPGTTRLRSQGPVPDPGPLRTGPPRDPAGTPDDTPRCPGPPEPRPPGRLAAGPPRPPDARRPRARPVCDDPAPRRRAYGSGGDPSDWTAATLGRVREPSMGVRRAGAGTDATRRRPLGTSAHGSDGSRRVGQEVGPAMAEDHIEIGVHAAHSEHQCPRTCCRKSATTAASVLTALTSA